MEPEQIARTALRKGLSCVGITDHDEIRGAIELSRIFPTIIGEEVSSDEGDVIGLFLNEKIGRGTALDTIDEIRAQGGLAVIPHPFDSLRRESLNSEEICSKGDFIEVFNSRVVRSRDNFRAKAFAEKTGLPGIVGSDAHTVLEIGRCWMDVDSVDDPKAFVESLRKKGNRIHTESSPIVVHLQTRILKAFEVLH